jgi:GNAT superfamily N-acetyltransferase
MDDVLIRPGEVADAEAVADVHVRSWQGAYRGLLPDSLLDKLSVEERARMWRAWLTRASDVSVWVADEGGSVIGFVAAGPQNPLEDRDVAEVYAIYLLPERMGRGLGRALLARAIDELRPGFGAVMLWVLKTNERARRFYEATGWRTDGATKTETVGEVEPAQVRYRFDLRS